MKCVSEKYNIGWLWQIKNSIDDSPDYQRESAIWSREKQQLFIDSLLNEFDIPKIYFHDLTHENKLHQYAIVDGKQRLHTIWTFMQDNFSLAEDFSLLTEEKKTHPLPANIRFSEFSDYWKEKFKNTSLSIVLVQNAEAEDIDELFSRLNNGEPLNEAEKRNAMGGEMCSLIREISKHKFFKNNVKFQNTRYQYYDLSAKFLLIEKMAKSGGDYYCDLKKKNLDQLVKENKNMSKALSQGLQKRVTEHLNFQNSIFKDKDNLLNRQSYLPLYYLFTKNIGDNYTHSLLRSKTHNFLQDFQVKYRKNLDTPEEERDFYLSEFGRLMQQGTMAMQSLRERVGILIRYFLLDNPDIDLKDVKRYFTEEERYVIWILSGNECSNCGKEIKLEEMDADHIKKWSEGGKTTLENARALCVNCNRSMN